MSPYDIVLVLDPVTSDIANTYHIHLLSSLIFASITVPAMKAVPYTTGILFSVDGLTGTRPPPVACASPLSEFLLSNFEIPIVRNALTAKVATVAQTPVAPIAVTTQAAMAVKKGISRRSR